MFICKPVWRNTSKLDYVAPYEYMLSIVELLSMILHGQSQIYS